MALILRCCRRTHIETFLFTYICTERARKGRALLPLSYSKKTKEPHQNNMAPKNFALQKLVAKYGLAQGDKRRTASPASPVPASNPWIPRDGYKDVKELQHGSEARTSLTKSIKTGRVYVVKRFPKYYVDASVQQGEQFLPNEAQVLLVALRPHENILRAFGCDFLGVQKGNFKANLYSEYCNGGDLSEHIVATASSRHSVPETMALHVFISLSQALCYLHHGLRWDSEALCYRQEAGFVSYIHGDIKCDNVFLRWSNDAERVGLPTVVLGDLGITQPAKTFVGISGTKRYQAPEVARIWALHESDPKAYRVKAWETGHMTTATDVYSLGQVIHMVGTNRTHATGEDPTTEPVVLTKRGMVGVRLGIRPTYWTAALTTAVQACLQPDSAARPVVKEGGLLDAVAVCRAALGSLIGAGRVVKRRVRQ
jgi:serine/threonine protein kinase